MAFAARYRGFCGRCDEPIEVGQAVEYDALDVLVHVSCPEPVPDKVVTICPDCRLQKPCFCD